MADQKISAMPAAATLTGAELVPLVQSGANVQSTIGDLRAFGAAYGGFSSTLDQTGSITVGTAMTCNTVDITDGITVVSNSRFTVPNDGIYNFQFSAQFKNVDNAQNIVTIWIKINGSDLANSATNVTIPARKSASIFGFGVASWNFYLDLNANDYVQLFWLPESTDVTLEALPLSVTPAYPAIPSLIVTMGQIA
jgi:hypothetical protein